MQPEHTVKNETHINDFVTEDAFVNIQETPFVKQVQEMTNYFVAEGKPASMKQTYKQDSYKPVKQETEVNYYF